MLKITTEKMRWLFCGLLLLAARGAGAVSHAAPAPAPSAGDHGEHKPDGCIKPPTCLKCHAMREDIQSCSTPGVSVEKRQAGYFFARIFLRAKRHSSCKHLCRALLFSLPSPPPRLLVAWRHEQTAGATGLDGVVAMGGQHKFIV